MGTVAKTQGMKLQVGDGASVESFTDIAGVTSWQDSGVQTGEGDCTDLASTQKEQYATLADPGSVTVEINIVDGDTEHQQLLDDCAAGTARNYQITKADGSTVRKAFNAFPKSFSQTGQADSHITASVELRLTGAATDTI